MTLEERRAGIYSAYDFLKKCLVRDDDADEVILDFLKEIAFNENNQEGQRLLLCLAIDVKCGAISDIDFLRNIIMETEPERNRLNSTSQSYRYHKRVVSVVAAFASVVNRKAFIERASTHQAAVRSRYARVISLESYLTYICEMPEKYNAVDDDFYISIFYQYEQIKVTRLGSGTGIVYVFPAIELNKVPRSANYLIDALGIYSADIKERTKFVLISYPSDFNHPCYQPCSLTADWGKVDGDFIKEGSPCYLSFRKKDGFGRTFSVTGSKPHFKERNHYRFTGVLRPYMLKSKYLGEITQTPALDRSGKIIETAITRFKECK